MQALNITGVGWTEEQKKQLHEALPNCTDIVWNENRL
jgi:hypothetical protein